MLEIFKVLIQLQPSSMQVYAIRQALSKSLVAYYQKYVDEQSKQEIKDILVQFDRSWQYSKDAIYFSQASLTEDCNFQFLLSYELEK